MNVCEKFLLHLGILFKIFINNVYKLIKSKKNNTIFIYYLTLCVSTIQYNNKSDTRSRNAHLYVCVSTEADALLSRVLIAG